MTDHREPGEFHLPTRAVCGEGCAESAGERAAALGAKRALLVTDRGVGTADHDRIAARAAATIGEYAVPRAMGRQDFLAVLRAADGG